MPVAAARSKHHHRLSPAGLPRRQGFDPLNLSGYYSIKYLREVCAAIWTLSLFLSVRFGLRVAERVATGSVLAPQAEVKHGRICMLATLGFVATDNGIWAPGAPHVSSLAAHDATVKSGHMLFLLFVLGACVPRARFCTCL